MYEISMTDILAYVETKEDDDEAVGEIGSIGHCLIARALKWKYGKQFSVGVQAYWPLDAPQDELFYLPLELEILRREFDRSDGEQAVVRTKREVLHLLPEEKKCRM